MSAVTPFKPQGGAMVTAEQAQAIRNALKNSLYPGATDDSVEMVLAYCTAAGLDPMTKPVHIVPMNVKKPGTRDQYEWRDVVMPGIELYRTKAHRTGEYGGQDEPCFGPVVEDMLGGTKVRFPEYCRVTVYRIVGGQRVPFTGTAYWLETYATTKRDSDAPNAMWKKRPFGQIEKCAEALALRKAFPEAVGAQPTAEEMEGRVIEGEATVVNDRPVMPQAKAVTHNPESATQAAAAEGEAAAAGEPGVHGLSPGQHKLLLAKAKNAGYPDETALLARHPSITAANLNDVLASLKEEADKADAN